MAVVKVESCSVLSTTLTTTMLMSQFSWIEYKVYESGRKREIDMDFEPYRQSVYNNNSNARRKQHTKYTLKRNAQHSQLALAYGIKWTICVPNTSYRVNDILFTRPSERTGEVNRSKQISVADSREPSMIFDSLLQPPYYQETSTLKL